MRTQSNPRGSIDAPVLMSMQGGVKRFGGLCAVDNVSFDVREGEAVGLIGPNGAGKSTTFNLITGVDGLTSGDVFYKGARITGTPLHRRSAMGMARTFQIVRLFGGLTVLENVMLGFHPTLVDGFLASLLRMRRVAADERRCAARAMELLQFVGLAQRAHDLVAHLPHGQQRLIEIARAMMGGARLILLDEPAAGLSMSELERLERLIMRICGLGATIVIVEHHLDLVANVASHVTVLDRGIVLAAGKPAAVFNDERVMRAYMGERALKAGVPA